MTGVLHVLHNQAFLAPIAIPPRFQDFVTALFTALIHACIHGKCSQKEPKKDC
jgi:hypothetical protein